MNTTTTAKVTVRLTYEQTTTLLELLNREQDSIGRLNDTATWERLEAIARPIRLERQIRQGQAAARKVNYAGFDTPAATLTALD